MKVIAIASVTTFLLAAVPSVYADPASSDSQGSCCNDKTFSKHFYTGFNGGVNVLCRTGNDHQKINSYTGYALGWEFGYRWSDGIRLEGEIAFRNNRVKSVSYLGSRINASGHVWSLSTLFNGIFEIPGFRQWCVTPYVGVGIGYAHQDIDVDQFHLKDGGGKDGFAWQAIGGVGYWFHDRADIAFEYRYRQGPASYLYDQTAQVAVKYHF